MTISHSGRLERKLKEIIFCYLSSVYTPHEIVAFSARGFFCWSRITANNNNDNNSNNYNDGNSNGNNDGNSNNDNDDNNETDGK